MFPKGLSIQNYAEATDVGGPRRSWLQTAGPPSAVDHRDPLTFYSEVGQSASVCRRPSLSAVLAVITALASVARDTPPGHRVWIRGRQLIVRDGHTDWQAFADLSDPLSNLATELPT